ncbi:MAG: class I SAM-dependent methyltransferase [bacterium]
MNTNQIIIEAAKRVGVVPQIHPEDLIFKFVIGAIANYEHAVRYYFEDGKKSAEKLRSILQDYGMLKPTTELLEFASGYGCVTRHLKNAIPEISVTSCDIHKGTIDFINSTMKLPVILSETRPEDFRVNKPFDVIFTLSFFSHMPKETWSRWLVALLGGLKKDGYLIFTAHGNQSLKKHFPESVLDGDGYWFKPSSEQNDLDVNDYGLTITLPKFVFNECYKLGAEIILFKEAEWWEHQDLYVIKKGAERINSANTKNTTGKPISLRNKFEESLLTLADRMFPVDSKRRKIVVKIKKLIGL